ncbi:Uncharacterised protein [Bordetella pertussis]|nr:Uncharacterised protein [Bordetella pertussis]CFO75221.1 Uncharacterised protein [Bordetella pertussis]CFU83296.1 Uncharacterised protein [Bordetella pertussis]CPI19771.1 Uncharacterised protein [Bordetella pertussis]CPL66126.1 Uncharacterised protein [Bordetella pertussis]
MLSWIFCDSVESDSQIWSKWPIVRWQYSIVTSSTNSCLCR